ncbi:glycosyl transferase family 2 [Phocaeicola salanitronis DSM 18170]|uniref:Glycosyl transferase family 2 n=1 Tax=Phocaeicola salanitronis (strain DSM 18170 / JCM 13657 / CCUG 60908 / BL78) TaxID=667015 RepID=F0R0F5_PHOSB|nr:glycosyltransferase family 2 protein [Phocaeicola salanitronis]ADY37299.1 glycosyl transferase family 2 [Phocaeicola salanitronis DSM 18170]
MKISIITATYNSGTTLRDTLESVLCQTYQDIECLVVDGASKDNTLDIVKSYETKFGGKLRYISEPDKGIYDAMNKGITMATGDVVGILNSDDFYTTDTILEQVAETMKAQPMIDAVYGDVHYVDEKDLSRSVRYYSSRLFKRSLMRFGFMPAHPSFYCRREVYERYGAFDVSYKVAADFENLLRLIFIHKIRTRYIPADFVTMRMGGASSSGLKSHRQIMKDHLRAMKQNGVFSNSLLLCFRYPYKVGEVVWARLTGRRV